MAYSGTIKFILENQDGAIVEETSAGASVPDAHRVVHGNFAPRARYDVITYNYDAPGANNDGRNITIV